MLVILIGIICLAIVVYITVAWFIIADGRIRLQGAKKRRKKHLKWFYGKKSIFKQHVNKEI